MLKALGVFAVFLAFAGRACAATRWNLSDLSILLPLPKSLTDRAVLRPETPANGGVLLPGRYLELAPPLALASKSVLSVVAVRIDPCFPGGGALDGRCHPQIRMIWQPLIQDATGVSAEDGAIHVFYQISRPEFLGFVRRLAALNADSGIRATNAPLGVNPLIARQGLDGPYWRKLRDLLLQYAGEAKIVRMTFMSLETPNSNWTFGGFNIVHGVAEQLTIARVQTPLQALVNTSSEGLQFVGGETPEPPENEDNFNRILERSSALTLADSPALEASAESILKIENPRIYSPDMIDCASCHSAQAAGMFLQARFPELNPGHSPYAFKSDYDLNDVTTPQYELHHVVRNFGYEASAPAISQRTINETAWVAEQLDRFTVRPESDPP